TNDDGSVDVISTPEEFSQIKDVLVTAGLNPYTDEVTYNASTSAVLDQDDAEKLLRMVDMLEDLDDVQNVYTNAEISDEILDAIN
ncbi:MAG: YebC/PmpR family DNA-binding transcriptional regulator, partial [Candidatus Thiodiazotropha sp.]